MDSRSARDLRAVTANGVALPHDLLHDGHLAQVRPVLEAIVRRRHEVVRHWYELYAREFGDWRALPQSEFVPIFESVLNYSLTALAEGRVGGFASAIIGLGESLVQRRMPLAEAVASLGLFEESAHAVFPINPPLYAVDSAFRRLIFSQVILLTTAYFSSRAAIAGEQIAAQERSAARLPTSRRTGFNGLVGSSPPMRQLYRSIEAAGQHCGTVLILGENGTRKNLVARAVHECSPRARQPFAVLDCKALPQALIESELFGFRRGPNCEHLGILRAAQGGTVFVREIAEIGAEIQSKLVHAVAQATVRPVGSTHQHPLDVRIIASTSRNPAEAIASHRLNPKLYDYLSASVIEVAPLRERCEDIPLLVDHFIALFNRKTASAVLGVSPQALQAMMQYSWPANVRELAAMVEDACAFCDAPVISLHDLPPMIAATSAPSVDIRR